MILTIDVGNTNMKMGAWDGDKLVFVAKLHTDTRLTADEYAVRFLQMMQLHQCGGALFDGAILSCVVPPLASVLKQAVERAIACRRVYMVSPGLKSGLNIKIDDPSVLGSDLVCAAVGALGKLEPPLIFINMETAISIFAINGDRTLVGGSVGPGVGISMEALSLRSAQLPHISLESPGPVIGKNTADSMKAGVLYGTAAMVDGMVIRMKEELGGEAPVQVIACGGHAKRIIPHCRETITVDENLVLDGLKRIYHKNAKAPSK
ncbi:type III pantothenate kinase [Ruminococcaceae bacterium OttesenSCG-928-L11]|nr:type III pantothenate kinase [Ruminococcaceae bacterium OttesenSCG-928-L11]